MSKTIFDHLKGITKDKIKWESLSEKDISTWDDYMITRWLSMNLNYIDYLNDIQQYRYSGLSNEYYYKLLYNTLPAHSTYFKYIKRSRVYEDKKELLQFFSNVYKISKRECLSIIDIFRKLELKSEFDVLLSTYGIQQEQQEKLRKELFDESK
jgi:AAA+ ATPase superfamily predicted ATPase